MPESRPPRFTVADAMLLIAATTPGLILLRIALGFGLFHDEPPPKLPPGRALVEYFNLAGGCILVSLSLTVLAMTARVPRSARRRLFGAPGFVACATIIPASILPVAYFGMNLATLQDYTANLAVPYNNMFGRLVNCAAPMIVGSWLALALAGRWKLRPIWTEWLGCGVGICWVVIYLYAQLYFIVALPLLRMWGW